MAKDNDNQLTTVNTTTTTNESTLADVTDASARVGRVRARATQGTSTDVSSEILEDSSKSSGGIGAKIRNGLGNFKDRVKGAMKSTKKIGIKTFKESMGHGITGIASKLNISKKAAVGIVSTLGGSTAVFVLSAFLGTSTSAAMKVIPKSDCEWIYKEYQANSDFVAPSDSAMKSAGKSIYTYLRFDDEGQWTKSSSKNETLTDAPADNDPYGWYPTETPDHYVFFPREFIAGLNANAIGESSLQSTCYEMREYVGPNPSVAGSAELVAAVQQYGYVLSQTHHINWDTYVNTMFNIYSQGMGKNLYWASLGGSPTGNDIKCDTYQYTNAATGEKHLYPGVGLWQWTGTRAYNLQQYANLRATYDGANEELLADGTLKYKTFEEYASAYMPSDKDNDGASDTMYDVDTQLAWLLRENWPKNNPTYDLHWVENHVSDYLTDFSWLEEDHLWEWNPGSAKGVIEKANDNVLEYSSTTNDFWYAKWHYIYSGSLYDLVQPDGSSYDSKAYEQVDSEYGDRILSNSPAIIDADGVWDDKGDYQIIWPQGEGYAYHLQDDMKNDDNRVTYKDVNELDKWGGFEAWEDAQHKYPTFDNAEYSYFEDARSHSDGTTENTLIERNLKKAHISINDDIHYVDLWHWSSDKGDGAFYTYEVHDYDSGALLTTLVGEKDAWSGVYSGYYRPACKELIEAQKKLEEAEQKVKDAEEAVAIAQAKYDQAVANAPGGSTLSSLEAAVTSALAELNAAKEELDKAKKEVEEAKELVEYWTKVVAYWLEQLDYITAQVWARIDQGIVPVTGERVAIEFARWFCCFWEGCPDLHTHLNYAAEYYKESLTAKPYGLGDSDGRGNTTTEDDENELDDPVDPTAPATPTDPTVVDLDSIIYKDWDGGWTEQPMKSLIDIVQKNVTNARMRDMWASQYTTECGGATLDNSSIAACAVSWAWPRGVGETGQGSHEDYYDIYDPWGGGDGSHPWQCRCTSLYVAVKNVVSDDGTYYSSCDRGGMTAVRASGSDDDFPPGACLEQLRYLRNEGAAKWTQVGEINAPNDFELCEPGDLLIHNHHTAVFVGPELAMLKWPDLGYTEENCKWAVVHSAIATTESSSRGPRFDPDRSDFANSSGSANGAYIIWRCVTPDGDASACRQAVEAMDVSPYWDGSGPSPTGNRNHGIPDS